MKCTGYDLKQGQYAEIYQVSTRTIRNWMHAGAPLDHPGQVKPWLTIYRQKMPDSITYTATLDMIDNYDRATGKKVPKRKPRPPIHRVFFQEARVAPPPLVRRPSILELRLQDAQESMRLFAACGNMHMAKAFGEEVANLERRIAEEKR